MKQLTDNQLAKIHHEIYYTADTIETLASGVMIDLSTSNQGNMLLSVSVTVKHIMLLANALSGYNIGGSVEALFYGSDCNDDSATYSGKPLNDSQTGRVIFQIFQNATFLDTLIDKELDTLLEQQLEMATKRREWRDNHELITLFHGIQSLCKHIMLMADALDKTGNNYTFEGLFYPDQTPVKNEAA